MVSIVKYSPYILYGCFMMKDGAAFMENFENQNDEILSEENQTEVFEKKNKTFNWRRELFDWIQAIVVALVVSFLLKNYVLTLAKVQGESMEPSLQHEDRLYVNRLMYEPEKGDVIIFRPASDPNRPYIKRIIATEGDTLYIDFVSGDVFVNDEKIDEPYINEETHLMGRYIESLIANGNYTRENPIVIEEDKMFVMGDNRNASKDSREIGQVPEDEIIGHAIFRFWPLNNINALDYKA